MRIWVIFFSLCWNASSFACICADQTFGFDSKADLTEYDFIALVKITASTPFWNQDSSQLYKALSIDVIDHYYGAIPEQIIDVSAYRSCSIGTGLNEEWLFYAFKTTEGAIIVTACERNLRYRSANGQRYSPYSSGIYYNNKLKQLYDHPIDSIQNGVKEVHYENGQIEIIEHYQDFQLHGERKIWNPEGQLILEEAYHKGLKDGPRKTYFRTGQLASIDHFKQGEWTYLSRNYYDTAYVKPSYLSSIWDAPVLLTESSGRKHIQVKDEDIYDGQGQILVSRYYYKNGQLKREILENGRYRTHIGYYPNGHLEYRYTT
ncbi:MAG: hypothetical protein AAFV80_21900, partial [Bacteroidota bacterium]